MSFRIPLIAPDLGEAERMLLVEAFDSDGVGQVGGHLEALEAEAAENLGGGCQSVALHSTAAAVHLALVIAGVKPGDEVYGPMLVRKETLQGVHQVGARLRVFDAERVTWNTDPGLLARAIHEAGEAGRAPAAVILSHLYGQCGDHAFVIDAAR